MRLVSARRLKFLISSIRRSSLLNLRPSEVTSITYTRVTGFSGPANYIAVRSSLPSCCFCSATVDASVLDCCFNTTEHYDSEVECTDDSRVSANEDIAEVSSVDNDFTHGVKAILDIMQEPGIELPQLKTKIEQCEVKVSKELVLEVLSRMRNDWQAAFTFFLWAGRQDGYSHTTREYHSMIAILGKMRKFDTAWTLIGEMRRKGADGATLVTPQTLLIMIRKFCAAHDVGRAINAFYAHKRFEFDVGMEQFHGLLSALCRYKNVQDAEHLMHCNKTLFPLNTKSFNIVLNGWCNAIGSPGEGERVWRQMRELGIDYDVVSCSTMISCYSKTGSLYRVLKLYDIMKDIGIEPNRKVYNAIIHALAKGGQVKEAINLIQTMEQKGIQPDSVTYNSLIKPLCTARRVDEASAIFDKMLNRGLSPTLRTFHALFHVLKKKEEVLDLLGKMKKFRCQPTIDTYIMLIRKFCRWRLLDDVSRLWSEIRENGISHDRSSYSALIHGLFLNGELDLAYAYYKEMKQKELSPEPKMDKLLQTWFSNKQMTETQVKELKQAQLNDNELQVKPSSKFKAREHFLERVETRRLVRHRGFSFLEK